jgi:hypothetical protein
VWTIDGELYVELSESGWSVLIGWLAGPGHLLGVPDRREDHQTRITTTDSAGTRTEDVTRTPEDQEIVDEAIRSYLDEAGAEPPPPGFRWFLKLPHDIDPPEFWQAMGAADPGGHAVGVVLPLRRALAELLPAIRE